MTTSRPGGRDRAAEGGRNGASKGYGQFCPIAQAAEVLTERWTLLVIRELLCGSTHFNELRRGVPLMSPTLLSKRLRTLAEAGVIERRADRGRGSSYHLTPAGEELRPLIEGLGVWGRRWAQREVREEDLDPGLLMWDVRRNTVPPADLEERLVVNVRFTDADEAVALWWLLIEPAQVDLCLTDPGHEVDLYLTTTVRRLTRIWLGVDDLLASLGAPDFDVLGPSHLVRAFAGMLRLSAFAAVEVAPPAAS